MLSATAHKRRSRRMLAIIGWSSPLALALAFLTPTSAQNQAGALNGLAYAPLMTRDQVAARIQALHDRTPSDALRPR
jgi:hypothetical protein